VPPLFRECDTLGFHRHEVLEVIVVVGFAKAPRLGGNPGGSGLVPGEGIEGGAAFHRLFPVRMPS
jgi:hypothetical protein